MNLRYKASIRCPLCQNIYSIYNIRSHYSHCRSKYEGYKKNQLLQRHEKYIKIKDQVNNQEKYKQRKEYNKINKKKICKQKEVYKQKNNTKIIKRESLYKLYTLTDINYRYTEYYYRYLNGKNVVLVGPASTIINTNSGNLINSFDRVVRLNKSLPLSNKLVNDIGNRTDILYNSLNRYDYPGENILDENFFINNGVKFLCTSYPNITPFSTDINHYLNNSNCKLPFRIINETLYNHIKSSIRTRPNTGIMAIMDLLKSDLKLLYITGLNFYKTPYYKTYKKTSTYRINNNIHNQQSQLNLLKYISLIDSRILLDKTLYKILYSNYILFFKKKKKFDNDSIFSISNISNNIFFNKNNKVLFIGYSSSIKEINNKYDVIFTMNSSNINNPYNIPIISIGYTSNKVKKNIKGIIKLNNRIINENQIDIYKFNKNHYNKIINILYDLKIYKNSKNIIELYFILCLLHYFNNINIKNISFDEQTQEYLLYKFIVKYILKNNII